MLRGFELTWASFSTLFIVWIWGPIEIREIARRQVVTRPTVTSNVDALESRGLCKRRSSEVDKRLVTVELTASGKAMIETVFTKFNKGEKQIASSLSAEEQQAAASLLRKIVA